MKKSKLNKRTRRKKRRWLFPLALIIIFILTTGASYLYFKDKFAFEPFLISNIEPGVAKIGHEGRKDNSVRLYKSPENNRHDQVFRGETILRKDSLLVAAEDIIRRYIKPYNVSLIDLYMDKEGIIYMDFSDELKKNFKGDAFEELTLIGGLYKKIKAAIPNFTAMKILIEGKEVESFGGHIDISKPLGEAVAQSIR
jgi:hypothetical protein